MIVKAISYVFSIAFIAVLFSICFLSIKNIVLSDFSGFDARIERRNHNEYPSFPHNVKQFSTYFSDFEKAFNDNFEFRNTLKYIYEDAYYTTTGGLFSKTFYYINGDGFAFLTRHPGGEPNSASSFRYSRIFEELQGAITPQLGRKFVTTETKILLKEKDFFESFPVPILFSTIVTKPYLEYDKLPGFIRKSLDKDFVATPPAQRAIDLLPVDFVSKFFHFPYKDILALRDNCDGMLIPEYNFHWKESSPYPDFVANSIASKFGVTRNKQINLKDYEKGEYVSEMQQFTLLSMPQNYNYLLKKVKGDNGVSSHFFINENSTREDQEKYVNFVRLDNANKDKTIFVVGDSFSPALRESLVEYFGHVYGVNNRDFGDSVANVSLFNDVFQAISPDYVLIFSHRLESYFIDCVDKLYKIAMSGERQIKFPNSNIILEKGWNKIEEWGVWSKDLAEIRFHVTSRNNAELILPYHFFQSVKKVEVYVMNGEEKITLPALTAPQGVAKIQISSDMINNFGYVDMFLKPTPPSSPLDSDSRILGIGLENGCKLVEKGDI